MDSAQIAAKVRCGACGGKIGRLNMVTLDRRALWQYPTSSNLLIPNGPSRAVAMCCDTCVDQRPMPEIKEVVEFRGGKVVYHAVEFLESLPPSPTFVIDELLGQRRIRCLVCGFTSSNPNDVLNRYCGVCHRFHETREAK